MSRYFDELEAELVRVAAARPGSTARRLGRAPRLALVATGLVLAAGVPAAALTGFFTPYTEPDGLVRLTAPRVLVAGTTPDGRPYALTGSRSGVGFCFGLRIPPIRGAEATMSEGCGGSEPGSLSLASSSGGSRRDNALVFGLAPDGAARVRVSSSGVTEVVATRDDRAGLRGRTYLAQLPIRVALGRITVEALDARGLVLAREALAFSARESGASTAGEGSRPDRR